MSQENDDDLMSGAPFQPVAFTATSARKWCERRKIDFSKVIKWELRDYGPNALVVVMAVRIDEIAASESIAATEACGRESCGHPRFVHGTPSERVAPVHPDVATCISCPAAVSAGGCVEFVDS